MFAVVSVTPTGGDTRGEPFSLDGVAPSTVSVQPSEVTGRPLGLSHRHLEVGRGTREVISGDCDSERRLHPDRHTSLDDQSRQKNICSVDVGTSVLLLHQKCRGPCLTEPDISRCRRRSGELTFPSSLEGREHTLQLLQNNTTIKSSLYY